MILVRINNIKVIKKIHKAYFDEFVINKIEKLMKDKKAKEECIDTYNFIKEFFYKDKEINNELLEDICYGDKKRLEQIIQSYEKQMEKYFSKKSLKKCLYRLDEYKRYLKEDGRGKECKRFSEWKKVIKDIKSIISNIENEKYKKYLEEEILKEEEKIRNYNIEKCENKNAYDFKFKNKKDIKNYLEIFRTIFIIKKENTIKKKIKEIFDYTSFRSNKIEINVRINEKDIKYVWNRHQLITMMGVSVCPYCNRQFISIYKDDKARDIKTTADLDHFYSQDEYPFLALSLYNFVPSCQICNLRFKNAQNFYSNKHIYPYEEEFGKEAKFKTSFYTNEDEERKENMEKLSQEDRYDLSYLLGNSDNFKIVIKPENPESEKGRKIQNSIDTFYIEDLYNCHKDYVRELIKKAVIYNESRINELYTQYPELFRSREEVLQLVVSNYINDDDLGKRPLAKLTKDICEELGLG